MSSGSLVLKACCVASAVGGVADAAAAAVVNLARMALARGCLQKKCETAACTLLLPELIITVRGRS